MSRLSIRWRWSTAVNSVETAPPTFCVGESGVWQLGELGLELLEPPHPPVVVGVVEGRVVEHEVAPARLLDLLGEQLVLVAGRGSGRLRVAHAGILPAAADTPGRALCRRRHVSPRCVVISTWPQGPLVQTGSRNSIWAEWSGVPLLFAMKRNRFVSIV